MWVPAKIKETETPSTEKTRPEEREMGEVTKDSEELIYGNERKKSSSKQTSKDAVKRYSIEIRILLLIFGRSNGDCISCVLNLRVQSYGEILKGLEQIRTKK